MKTNKWYPITAGGKTIAVKVTVVPHYLNHAKIEISVPCRVGQKIVLDGVDNERFNFAYYKGKCIVSYLQNTNNMYIDELFIDISIWFRYTHAVRLDDGENKYTIKELYKALSQTI